MGIILITDISTIKNKKKIQMKLNERPPIICHCNTVFTPNIRVDTFELV